MKSVGKKKYGRTCFVAWGQRVRDAKNPPKNSLPMIPIAKEIGYDAIELDVRISSDGIPVLSHDEVLGGQYRSIHISENTAEEIEEFRLGVFEEKPVYIPNLQKALELAKPLDVQIDGRVDAAGVAAVRKAVDLAGFDRANLQFCVYNQSMAAALVDLFPESILLWKKKSKDGVIDQELMDRIKDLNLDGVMVPFPRTDHTVRTLTELVHANGLRALVYIHGRHETFPEGRDKALYSICATKVDYVTTFAGASEAFQTLRKQRFY